MCRSQARSRARITPTGQKRSEERASIPRTPGVTRENSPPGDSPRLWRYNGGVQPDPSSINLPHALTIVARLRYYLEYKKEPTPVEETEVCELLDAVDEVLRPFPFDPPPAQAIAAALAAAESARRLAAEMAHAGYVSDRLGQCVRNLFECLGLPEEGAALSLKCGERPDSLLRP